MSPAPADDGGGGGGGGQNIPIPDPSLMTTKQLQREVFSLRELLEVKLGSASESIALVKEVIETRLEGNDRAIRLLQDTADKFPARIDEKIASLRAVHDERFGSLEATHGEKFVSIQKQFSERDVRTDQSSKDSKTAVDAALQAAKEAVGKSETATLKQIDQLGVLIASITKSADDKISDLKERLTRLEGRGEGGASMWAYITAGVGLLIGLAGFLLVVFDLGKATP